MQLQPLNTGHTLLISRKSGAKYNSSKWSINVGWKFHRFRQIKRNSNSLLHDVPKLMGMDKSTAVNIEFNPLKTKRRLLYLETQAVPRCKHFSSRL